MSEEQFAQHTQTEQHKSPIKPHHVESKHHDNASEAHKKEDHQDRRREQIQSPETDSTTHHNLQTQSPNKQNAIASPQYSPETRANHSHNASSQGRLGAVKISGVPGLILDELTEYAMAREGIDIEDLMPKPFEDFMKECNGNQKLAQIRFEYKEAERQGNKSDIFYNIMIGLMQDIENRKKDIQTELVHDHQYSSNFQQIQSPQHTYSPNQNGFFFQTQQPSMLNPKLSRMSQSQAQLSLQSPQQHTFNSLRGMARSGSKKQVDNKIFENMLRNQVEQEVKLRSIQERQEMFLMKSNQLQERRQREIMKKQEMLQQKQVLKEEKLRRQEQIQQKWQMETLTKLRIKSEITDQRQLKFKQDLKLKMQEKEIIKEQKRHHAQEMYVQYVESLSEKQKEVEVKNNQFKQKLEDKSRKQKDIIIQKKVKKEQIFNSVQEQRDQDEQKKMERFMEAQFMEMEKERRIEEEKKRQQEHRHKMGQDKTERLIFKVDEAYKKMAEWQQELERRERTAEDTLKKQQQILAEKQQVKREMKKLKQESAQLKQKRKENKQKLKNEEQLTKLYSMFDKMDKFKSEKQELKQKKQQEIFKAEQKRADMKTAFYHMSVWNVNEAGDIIKEILEENDHRVSNGLKPKSVAEKVREKAARIRREERLGLSQISPKNYEGHMNFISEEEDPQELDYVKNHNGQAANHENNDVRGVNSHHQNGVNSNLATQKVVYDKRQQL